MADPDAADKASVDAEVDALLAAAAAKATPASPQDGSAPKKGSLAARMMRAVSPKSASRQKMKFAATTTHEYDV